jgi:hypothetical protein
MEQRYELKEKILGFTERDAHSKALLNTDMTALQNYRLKKQKAQEQAQEFRMMKSEISSLKEDLSEIRQLLLAISKKNCV